MLSTSIGWWIYELTHDPFSIGLLGLAEIVPALSFALYAGHVIDLSDKKKILLKGVFFYLCCALLLFLLSGNYTSRHLGTHWIVLGIYAVIFCSGIVRAFAGPTFAVLLAYIVPKETLQNATTWNQYLAFSFGIGACCRWISDCFIWYFRIINRSMYSHDFSHDGIIIDKIKETHRQ